MKYLECFWTYFTDYVFITQCPWNVLPPWFILYCRSKNCKSPAPSRHPHGRRQIHSPVISSADESSQNCSDTVLASTHLNTIPLFSWENRLTLHPHLLTFECSSRNKVRHLGDNFLVPIRAEQSNPSFTPCSLCWRKLKGEAVRKHSSPGMLVKVLDSN